MIDAASTIARLIERKYVKVKDSEGKELHKKARLKLIHRGK
jgi:hypothetical protein